jgi:glucose/arabinose dehydrogenase
VTVRRAAWVLLALTACGGGGGGGSEPVPPGTPLSYARNPASYRAGSAIASNLATSGMGSPATFTVLPALPDGLVLHPSTGTVSGTPTTPTATAPYEVTVTGPEGTSSVNLVLQVTPALPSDVDWLADGFEIELVVGNLAFPSKFAFAPDGRIFFTELQTGNVRVIESGALVATPFATLPVLTGAEQGLLGIALADDFGSSGHVFLFASTPAGDGKPARNRVLRLTASGNTGSDLTVLVDDLPIGNVHNAGDVQVGPDGHLYVTLGDTSDSSLAQEDGSRAGRVLRYTVTGAVPAGNPIPGDPEWCRGLRNSFGLAFHPTTDGLFASENGPTSQDEINFVQSGKNYGWPSGPSGGSTVGFRVTQWTPVIAPTGISFCTGGVFGPGYDDNLFVAGYVEEDVRRLVLSGTDLTDLDAEHPFLDFDGTGGANKPLDLEFGPGDALYVSTTDAIWRVRLSP